MNGLEDRTDKVKYPEITAIKREKREGTESRAREKKHVKAYIHVWFLTTVCIKQTYMHTIFGCVVEMELFLLKSTVL